MALKPEPNLIIIFINFFFIRLKDRPIKTNLEALIFFGQQLLPFGWLGLLIAHQEIVVEVEVHPDPVWKKRDDFDF
jgi:hypothetical protein